MVLDPIQSAKNTLFQLVSYIKDKNPLNNADIEMQIMTKQVYGEQLTPFEESLNTEIQLSSPFPVISGLRSIFLLAGELQETEGLTNQRIYTPKKPLVDLDKLESIISGLDNAETRSLYMHAYNAALISFQWRRGDNTISSSLEAYGQFDRYAKDFNIEDLK